MFDWECFMNWLLFFQVLIPISQLVLTCVWTREINRVRRLGNDLVEMFNNKSVVVTTFSTESEKRSGSDWKPTV